MQLRLPLKYCLFALLMLFTAINTAVADGAGFTDAGSVNLSIPAKHPPLYAADTAPGKGDVIHYNCCLTDLFLSNVQVVQIGVSVAGKRVQVDKDLLLLHSTRCSNAVKATAGDDIKFADSLRHIFLFLFPYHFFW